MYKYEKIYVDIDTDEILEIKKHELKNYEIQKAYEEKTWRAGICKITTVYRTRKNRQKTIEW